MAVRATLAASIGAVVIVAGTASGAMSFLTQARSVTASTTFDGQTDTKAAPDFNPFVQTASVATFFPSVTGTSINRAVAGIDCHLDPNKIKVVGSLAAAGGLSLVNGEQAEEIGDAVALVSLSFHIDADSPFVLAASARPSSNPKDKFKIKLAGPGGGNVVFFMDEKVPAQSVQFAGVLGAGDYTLEYEAELSSGGPDTQSEYAFTLDIPAPSVAALLGVCGLGLLRRRR